ncbi:MAG: chorismate mutase [Lachnospiraceae bacterium]|nr:chorismate mutase [Lachnospiraceae bacterium]
MRLDDIRKNINEIDDKMKTLFDARMECAAEVAKVKIETGDSIYKPVREKEMYERFMDNPDYVAFLKKVVQISRRNQYELFLDNNKNDDLSDKFKSEDLKDGKLNLMLKPDEKSERGLCIKDILSVISSSKLNVECIEVNKENINFSVTFNVPEDEISQKEAYLIKYMLESETL